MGSTISEENIMPIISLKWSKIFSKTTKVLCPSGKPQYTLISDEKQEDTILQDHWKEEETNKATNRININHCQLLKVVVRCMLCRHANIWHYKPVLLSRQGRVEISKLRVHLKHHLTTSLLLTDFLINLAWKRKSKEMLDDIGKRRH